MNIIHIKTI